MTGTAAAAAFFGLEATDDPLTWRLPVSLDVCGATGTLHGGCGLGAAVAALELSTERPLAAASAQYLSRAAQGSEVSVELEIRAAGKAVTQAGFRVVEASSGTTVLQGHASLGGRELGIDRQWTTMPDAPDRDSCPRRVKTSQTSHAFTDLVDLRVAFQEPGNARNLYWAHLPDGLARSAPVLTALADLLPSGMRVGLDQSFRGSSLDNTVRMAATQPDSGDGWVLIELVTDAFSNSVGQGMVRVFSSDGDLLATGNQAFGVTRMTGPLDR